MATAQGRATLAEPVRSTLEFAVKLTRRPADMQESDLVSLREAGLDDEAILHIVEIVAYFNFVNRLADGLAVSLED